MMAVRARDLGVRYGKRWALESSSFDIPGGAITALIGPNGSGKSTLLNAIAGLVTPSAGTITFDDDTPSRIAYVFQSTKVNESLPVTVAEVVAMGRYAGKGPLRRLRAADRKAVDEAMVRMDIVELANRHMTELSGGQRQRVFVAQGLAQDHDLLLLDEPLTGLDLPSAQAIDRVIHDEPARGCTVVMTTHDLAEARVADHVILLSGRVVASGLPHDVLTFGNLAAAYGATSLHIEGERLFIDDPHHDPTVAHHRHQDRSIHIESSIEDVHGP